MEAQCNHGYEDRVWTAQCCGVPLVTISKRLVCQMKSTLTEKESTEYWLGQHIQDSVEDCLGIGGDDIATLGKTPSDWVQEPKLECIRWLRQAETVDNLQR